MNRSYWDDRLELGMDMILVQVADDRRLAAWIDTLTPPCRAILIEHLGLDPGLSNAETRAALLARRHLLMPFVMIHAAAAGKRMDAIVAVARATLSARELHTSRVTDDDERFDRVALLWRLYLRDRTHLELVSHLDRIERRGAARMILTARPPGPSAAADVFFARDHVQRLVDAYEFEQNTRRHSHCAAVLHDGGTYKVVIKRDHRPGLVARGVCNMFGFEPEWIILDFAADLRRVQISSLSPDVPLRLANRIASAYFGRAVTYTNEVIPTPSDTITAFLQSLLGDVSTLPLVALTARNSSLDCAPQLRFHAATNTSLARAIRHYAAVFGNPMDAISDIESIQVYGFGTRITMTFTQAGDTHERFVVRYDDQVLTRRQRRAFEHRMAQDYGIVVVSAEMRDAR